MGFLLFAALLHLTRRCFRPRYPLYIAAALYTLLSSLSSTSAFQFNEAPISRQQNLYRIVGSPTGVDGPTLLSLPPFNATQAFADADQYELDLFLQSATDSNGDSNNSMLAPPTPPFRWGVEVELSGYDLLSDCNWRKVESVVDSTNVGVVCEVRVQAKSVDGRSIYGIQFRFGEFRVAPGSQIIAYSMLTPEEVASVTLRADDEGLTHQDFSLVSPVVPYFDNGITLEIFVPATASAAIDQSVVARLQDVVVDVKDISHGFQKGFCGSGSCNIDITCQSSEQTESIEGLPPNTANPTDWTIERRAVALVFLGGSACSGSLIVDPLGTRNLFYIANHCTAGKDPAMFVFHFGAERPCNTGCSSPQFTSSEFFSVSGAVELGTSTNGDWTLLEITGTIPESAPVYYLGWDAAPSFSSGSFAVGISHPDADFKKFTLFTDLSDQGSFIVSTEWLAGWIEGGSSGSPLLLADTRKVIGTASAIDSCSFNQPCNGGCNSVAYYGDFATAFFQGGMRHILFGENEPFQTSMEASSTKSPETTENDDSNNQQPDDDVDDLGNPPVSEGCESFCGVQSDAGCWCDGLCSAFGDCCQDFAQVCSGASGAPDIVPSASPPPPSPPPPSPPPQYCLGKCGKPGNRQCIQVPVSVH